MPPRSEEQQEKQRAAQVAIEQIKERYGEGSIMRFSEARAMQVDTVPTGSISLDIALGFQVIS